MKIALVVTLVILGEALGAVLPRSIIPKLVPSVIPNAQESSSYSSSSSTGSSVGTTAEPPPEGTTAKPPPAGTTAKPQPPPAGTTAKPPPPSKCECGKANRADRIVGGTEVKPKHKYPWQVFLLTKVVTNVTRTYSCGGTIVNKRFVITAMHCIQMQGVESVFVVPGIHDVNEASTKKVKVKNIIKNSKYDPQAINNDIAILELEKDLVFSKEIAPACLPTNPKETYAGKMAVVSGWGRLEDGGAAPDNLYEVDLRVIPQSVCKTMGYGPGTITPQMLCAGYKEGKKSACNGDSGGPLAVEENGVYTLIGVVSFGRVCAEPNYPTVFARVTAFLGWIHENIKPGDCKA